VRTVSCRKEQVDDQEIQGEETEKISGRGKYGTKASRRNESGVSVSSCVSNWERGGEIKKHRQYAPRRLDPKLWVHDIIAAIAVNAAKPPTTKANRKEDGLRPFKQMYGRGEGKERRRLPETKEDVRL